MEYDIWENTTKNTQHVLQINADNFGNGGTSAIISRFDKELTPKGYLFKYLTFKPGYKDENSMSNLNTVFVKKINFPILRPLSKIIGVKKRLNEEDYDIIHINGDDIIAMGPYILAAKLSSNPPRIILHSHTSRGNSKSHALNAIRDLFCHILGLIIISKSESLVACSTKAAIHAFGKNNLSRVHIIKNGIDFQKYAFNNSSRKKIRSQYSVSDECIVIGHIGQFSYAKNHLFIIDIFEEYHKLYQNSELWLIGTGGNLEKAVKKKASKSICKDSIKFLGHKGNVEEYLSAMDIFIFPSHYEGFPLALTEAQACGLPCIYSDSITKECIFSNNVNSVSLSNAPCIWAEKIKQMTYHQHRTKLDFSDISLDIRKCSEQLITIYSSNNQ